MTEAADPSAAGSYAIEVHHLTKTFRIYHQGAGSLKVALIDMMKRFKLTQTPHFEDKVALNDVSFVVPHGQTIAIIGRNGSGKSTLLSILARVYLPASGSFRLCNAQGGPARIAPLLELGAGFHPDMTGLDNLMFYAAVLGMNRQQVNAKLSDILEFAEIAEKLDTRLHGWNEGAKLRLGFSIAVHTDPDILLVDEVLAVGDEAFQNKCYKRIAQLQAEGKTILFVTHDLPVVERVANRILWMGNGVIRQDGDVPTVLAAYREDSMKPDTENAVLTSGS